MSDSPEQAKEYSVSVRTDDIRRAIATLASALYTLAEEAIGAMEDEDIEEGDYEIFLRDVLGILARHADHLSGVEECGARDIDESLVCE